MTLGPVGQRISAKLAQAFAPAHLEVIDESHHHAGHSGSRPDGESHFRVRIAAEDFRGKSRVQQHRMVNATLADELKSRVHALAIESSAPKAAPDLAFVALTAEAVDLADLLAAAGLASDDLRADGLIFTGIRDGSGKLLACGGLQLRGDAALLRSIAVSPDARKGGLGTAITFKLLSEARNSGAQAAYLLTASAAPFFSRLSFTAIGRDKVPAPIVATSQFTGTTCAAAQAMVHVLAR